MHFQLEDRKRFSKSLLWQLQRQYFEEMGFEAWRRGEVPHYVTSNQRIANSYAEIILGFYKDTIALSPPDNEEPMYILEGGAGSGRFGYYLVKRLHWLCEQENIPVTSFCYILSDFTQSNPDFWKPHPLFEAYFAEGTMDVALFDMTAEAPIDLQISGRRLERNGLAFPLVFIANYLFDSIPQELYYCKEGKCFAYDVSLHLEEDPNEMYTVEILEKLVCTYHQSGNGGIVFPETWMNKVFAQYRENIEEAYFFFPETGLRSLTHLRSFSEEGLLVLTADKGQDQLDAVCYTGIPAIVKHGSFSLSVNYHALATYTEQVDGAVYFPEHDHSSINTGCLLFVKEPENYVQTKTAAIKYLGESGPDDYFALYTYITGQVDTMPLNVILSSLRFSLYDSHLLDICLSRLAVLSPDFTYREREDVFNTINQCWENYFPIAEYTDLANRIATLLYMIDYFEGALFYFKMSADVYGNDAGTLFNIAACYQQIGEEENARTILAIVMEKDPGNTAAKELLDSLQPNTSS